MRYKLLGNSGLRVSELCLGTMTFGEDWGWGASFDECKTIYETFREAGGNFIDTANIYTNGMSEKYIGELIASEREEVVVSTKYSQGLPNRDPNGAGIHRKRMVQSVEASLKRLNTDYIDLLWLHAWDFTTPPEEVMRSLDDLVRQGKVLYVGISDAPAWVVAQCNTIADLRGWTPFIGLQLEYTLLQRTVERELLPMARTMDLGITVWSPLANGWLTGKYTQENGSQESKRLDGEGLSEVVQRSDRNLAILRTVGEVATQIGCSSAQVALAWLLHQNTIPIVGARKATQVKDNLDCVNVKLSDEQLTQLDQVSQIELGFPHDFFNQEAPWQLFMFGGQFKAIDNHRYTQIRSVQGKSLNVEIRQGNS
jgi:aryl-alcohol dehydrogenase-like predicted oxidoreductase